MKKLSALILSIMVCLLLCFAITTVTADGVSGTAGDLTWTIEDNVLTITGRGIIPNYSSGSAPWYPHRESISSIVIGDEVTSIGTYAFAGMTTPGEISIGSEVLGIGNYAFSGCTSLTDVILPEKLMIIGIRSFENCASLGSITFPNSMTRMGQYAFTNCDALGTVRTGDGLKAISSYAFYDCNALSTLVIGDGVTSIDEYAFTGCNSLSNVTIGRGVTSIGNYAFGGKNETYKTVGNHNYWYRYSGCNSLRNIVIPDNVTSIGNYAFSGSGLVSVVMGSGVTNIGTSAFSQCTEMTSLSLGSGLTSIGQDAFAGCTGLSRVVIPDNVTSIGQGAFCGCGGMIRLTLGENVVSIGSNAFNNCSILSKVIAKENLSTVELNAFTGCAGLLDVYYTGSEDDKALISFKNGNSYFTDATWHFGLEPEHNLVQVNAIEPTCLAGGNISYFRCTDCDVYFSLEDGTTKLAASDVMLDPLGHEWGEWIITKEPTPTTIGVKTRTCQRCYTIDKEAIPMLEVDAYTVTYHANGGTGTPTKQIKYAETDLVLSDKAPTKAESTFRSWNTEADGTGTVYKPGDTYSTDADLNLYAQWISNDRILTLPTFMTTIESEAFVNTAAEAIRIPASTTEIADDAFDEELVIITCLNSPAAEWAEENHYEYIIE